MGHEVNHGFDNNGMLEDIITLLNTVLLVETVYFYTI